MNVNDPLKSTHAKEFAELRRSPKGTLRLLLKGGLGLLVLVLIVLFIHKDAREWQSFLELRRTLVSSGEPWVRTFIDDQEYFDDWIARRGLPFERRIFNELSAVLMQSAAAISTSSFGGNGFLGSTLESLHLGMMRVSFVLLACWRLWVAVIIGAWFWGRRKLLLYQGADILGLSGNGRAFFSGARVDLRHTAPSGAPSLHVTGLACPARVSKIEARSTGLGKLLERYGVVNDTTLDLAAILMHHRDLPAYLVLPEEENLLKEAFEGEKLLANAERVLERALSLHAYYRSAAEQGGMARRESRHPEVLADSAHLVAASGKVRAEDYPKLLQRAMHRVLRPALQKEMAELEPKAIAVLVLAVEAGKVLAYRRESDRWVKRSNFPQLSARAVLHSLPSYGKDYAPSHRDAIRRALVYASRHSVFSSVRFPVDMDGAARALRQWSEVLIAAPHTLQGAADEVELFGLVSELHVAWSHRFIEGVATSTAEVVEGCYVAQGNLVFVPVERITKMIRAISDPVSLQRLEELVFLVSQRQRIQSMAADLANDSEPRIILASNERIFSPLSNDQSEVLATNHGLSASVVREWSSMRVILNAFGWLGRRVGDYTVPENSIIFSVFKFETPAHGANALGLLGTKGMVALRATRLEARLGRQWRGRFTEALSATMAETTDIYEKLLKGVVSEPIEESLAAGA